MKKRITLVIEEGESGLWFATSEGHPSLFVAAVGHDALVHAMSRALLNFLERSSDPQCESETL